MRKSSESFELEHRGLHAVSERVADLRNAVKECEARFAVLDAASQGTAAVPARSGPPASRPASSRQELARLWPRSAADQRVCASNAERIETLGRRHRPTGCAGSRSCKPEIEDAVRDLASLKGTKEMMADGLEQMRVAYEEMSRLRESHGETQDWLARPTPGPGRCRPRCKELSGMEPAVERIRGDVEQVKPPWARSRPAARRCATCTAAWAIWAP